MLQTEQAAIQANANMLHTTLVDHTEVMKALVIEQQNLTDKKGQLIQQLANHAAENQTLIILKKTLAVKEEEQIDCLYQIQLLQLKLHQAQTARANKQKTVAEVASQIAATALKASKNPDPISFYYKRGLNNPSSTCYLNSVMVAFRNISVLRQLVDATFNPLDTVEKNTLQREMYQVLQKMDGSSLVGTEAESLLKALQKCGWQEQKPVHELTYQQHHTSELLIQLLGCYLVASKDSIIIPTYFETETISEGITSKPTILTTLELRLGDTQLLTSSLADLIQATLVETSDLGIKKQNVFEEYAYSPATLY